MPGFWRQCRTVFRWTRYCIWLLIVLGLLALGWINIVGFPDMVKNRLTAAMQDHGVTLKFSRMRWQLIHGLVAENVIIGGQPGQAPGPLFTAGQIQLRLDYGALVRRKFQLDSVVVRDGIFTLPVTPTNRLVMLNMQAEVSFLPDETWSLDELRADFAGAQIRLAGQLAHAPEIMKWQVFAGKKPGGGQGALTQPLRDFSDALARIQLAGPPQISATLGGDARDVHSLILRVNATVPGVTTPWVSGQRLQFAASLTAPANAPVNFDAALDFWTNALPFRLAWTVRAAGLGFKNLDASAVEFGGVWSAPQLAVTTLAGHFGGGDVNASGTLDVATRALNFTNTSAFDPHALKAFLPADLNEWLAHILWTQPPSLAVGGFVTVPAWTNQTPDWRGVIGPTSRLGGELACTNAIVDGRIVELARTHFKYADLIWSTPDLVLAQGRTRLEFSGAESTATENFNVELRGKLAAETVRPFLPTNISGPLFELVKLGEPVVFNLETSGNLRDLNTLTATGHVALADLTVRAENYESVVADFSYSDRRLFFSHPSSLRAQGTQMMTADAVILDWNTGMYYFRNGYSTTDPMAVVRAIGPKTAALIAPYQFLAQPVGRVNGQLPMRNMTSAADLAGTDMTFEVIKGVPFRWEKLTTTNIMGTVHWKGPELILTNVTGSFYGGAAGGGAYFNFGPVGYACDFQFDVSVTNADVHLLGLDLSTNQANLIEGRLTGHVAVTSGNSKTWQSWNGFGNAQLRDGLLWNIPIFGFASQALDTVAPGLGNSRATGASLKFGLTNGVARSDLLEIHTLTMRLQYAGTVDLEGNANARVTAQFLRNTPVLGSIISTFLWPVSKIFECQITGKVFDPTVTPVYFPFSKDLLHPIRAIKQMIPSGDGPKG